MLRSEKGNSGNLHGHYLVVRADASAEIGTGHFMRCLALTQAWKDNGGKVIFITLCKSEELLKRLNEEDFEVKQIPSYYPDSSDLETTLQVLAQYPDSWIVLDGYHFDTSYQKTIKEAGYHLLVIDDMGHLPYYHVDILLNQNINAERLSYRCDSATQLLLGTRYALLRQDFLPWRGWKREVPKLAHKILVTLGGADSGNVTFKIIDALKTLNMSELEVRIVVGPANPNIKSIENAALFTQCNFQILQQVENMPELMAWADVAISAGGTTCLELAFMGLPSIVLVLAENQRLIAESLRKKGIALNLGWHEGISVAKIVYILTNLLFDKDKRMELSHRARKIIDGLGAMRVAECIAKMNQNNSGIIHNVGS